MNEEKNKDQLSPTPLKLKKYEKNRKKIGASKYDFVKVKVKLAEHYYILSRFIVSRMLTVIKVKYRDAVKISLELKKRLVDKNTLELTHQELEKILFDILKEKGYQNEIFNNYEMISRFHHQRVTLLILIFGTGCVGKSDLATKLSEILNIANLLATDIVFDIMNFSVFNFSKSKPIRLTNLNEMKENKSVIDFETKKKNFLEKYKSECLLMRKAVQGDIEKGLNEGKSIIIEGNHLDPSLFHLLLKYFNLFKNDYNDEDSEKENNFEKKFLKNFNEEEVEFKDELKFVKKYKQRGIIVPVFIDMKQDDHFLFEEQWLASRNSSETGKELGNNFRDRLESLNINFRIINEYLNEQVEKENKKLKNNENKIENIEVNLQQLSKTVDGLHQLVLSRIEKAYNINSKRFPIADSEEKD